MRKKTTITALVILCLVLALASGCKRRVEEPVARGPQTKCYSTSGGDKWVCGSGGEFEIQSGGTLDIQSGATAGIDSLTVANGLTVTAGGLTVTAGGATITAGGLTLSDGDAVVADDLRVTAQTAITVTNGAAFTATGTYQGIQAAGEVTPTITAGTAGDLLILTNVSAQTINLADTGTQKLTAAFAMGQYDTLTLLSDGTNWLELSRADN